VSTRPVPSPLYQSHSRCNRHQHFHFCRAKYIYRNVAFAIRKSVRLSVRLSVRRTRGRAMNVEVYSLQRVLWSEAASLTTAKIRPTIRRIYRKRCKMGGISYYYSHNGSRIRAFHWYRNWQRWMAMAVILLSPNAVTLEPITALSRWN